MLLNNSKEVLVLYEEVCGGARAVRVRPAGPKCATALALSLFAFVCVCVGGVCLCGVVVCGACVRACVRACACVVCVRTRSCW